MSRDITKPTKWMCAQQRLGSAGHPPRLICVFAGRTLILLVVSCSGSNASWELGEQSLPSCGTCFKLFRKFRVTIYFPERSPVMVISNSDIRNSHFLFFLKWRLPFYVLRYFSTLSWFGHYCFFLSYENWCCILMGVLQLFVSDAIV